jgi:hypothetical protein
MSASRLFSVIIRDGDLLLTDIYAGVLLLLYKQKAYQTSVLAQVCASDQLNLNIRLIIKVLAIPVEAGSFLSFHEG